MSATCFCMNAIAAAGIKNWCFSATKDSTSTWRVSSSSAWLQRSPGVAYGRWRRRGVEGGAALCFSDEGRKGGGMEREEGLGWAPLLFI
ncbi:hypothetical protein ACFXTI_013054 [Malus domestica]